MRFLWAHSARALTVQSCLSSHRGADEIDQHVEAVSSWRATVICCCLRFDCRLNLTVKPNMVSIHGASRTADTSHLKTVHGRHFSNHFHSTLLMKCNKMWCINRWPKLLNDAKWLFDILALVLKVLQLKMYFSPTHPIQIYIIYLLILLL